MNDTELLKQYLTGSEQAFAELVGRHGNWIYSVARRRVRDEHLAEDITQAVFILLAQGASAIYVLKPYDLSMLIQIRQELSSPRPAARPAIVFHNAYDRVRKRQSHRVEKDL